MSKIKDIVETIFMLPIFILLAVARDSRGSSNKTRECMMCEYEGTTDCPCVCERGIR